MRGVTSAWASIGAARGDDGDPFAGVIAELVRQLHGNFAEHFRLQFGEMRQRARHAAGGVMFGEAVGGQHVRKSCVRRTSRIRCPGASLVLLQDSIACSGYSGLRTGDSSGS